MKIDVKDNLVSLAIDGTFTAEQLGELITKLTQARAQALGRADGPHGMTPVKVGGGWQVVYNALAGGHIVFLDLADVGWKGLMLTTEGADQLSQLLARQVEDAKRGAATASNADILSGRNEQDPGAVH